MATDDPGGAGEGAVAAGPVPRATYRLQLNAGFDFAAAIEVLPYLARLGVSHVYCSPVLQAAAGSTHGYDVVDPRRVSAELGGEEGWLRFLAEARRHGLGVVLDIVPNHMAITSDNPWWWDVLENGRASRYARTFDVDWSPPEPALRDTVLMPVLADHYGRELEDGAISLRREGGAFLVVYDEHRMPLAPRSLDELLDEAARRAGSDELATLAGAFGALPPSTADDILSVRRRHRDKEVLRGLLERLLAERKDIAEAVDEVVDGIARDPDRLDALLERQNYRLAFWRTAGRDLGYRRFFDITTLAGLRMEDQHVFEETHELTLRWATSGEGAIDGLRVDHPDGLRDPAAYLERLRHSAPRTWIVVEKILQAGEPLRPWPVDGTSGYDFLRLVDGLFVDPAGEEPLSRSYAAFTGAETTFPEVAYEARIHILHEVLGSELNHLTAIALRVCERHRRHRDHTRHDLHEALRELCAAFPVYRTYVRADAGLTDPADEAAMAAAVRGARVRRPDLGQDLIDFLASVLTLGVRGPLESELAMRFQQLTSAVMAKGVEDTALYRYARLLSLNEVGSDPQLFGTDLDPFHLANIEAQRRWPGSMLATSTHDTKRSEDVRARLHVLSELPDAWDAAVRRWSGMNARHRRHDTPDRNTEWFLYQTLVGAWPIEPERLQTAMLKSVREAKEHTSWTRPDEVYEAAVAEFIDAIMDDSEFRADAERFVERIAEPARLTSLSMTLLKLTAVGVPDLYQGTELWARHLVDPDNRRTVDFELRERMLGEALELGPEDALQRPLQGMTKIWLIARALAVRRERSGAFGPQGIYRPLRAEGTKADHVVAFSRADQVVVVAPRLLRGLGGEWGDTGVGLPQGVWHDRLGEQRWPGGGSVRLAELLAHFPMALLVRESADATAAGT